MSSIVLGVPVLAALPRPCSATPALPLQRPATGPSRHKHCEACTVRADPHGSAKDRPLDLEEFDREFVGLLPDEDHEVPGGYNDSLSQNTKLGRAVNDACIELDALAKLEKENLEKASDLLRQLGYKGDLFQLAQPSEAREESSPG